MRVFAVGTVPPPVHGMSLAFQAAAARLREAGLDVRIFNVAAPASRRNLVAHLRKLLRYVKITLQILLAHPTSRDALYICVAGGYGLLFDSILLALIRATGLRPFIHHHNFSYLNAPRWEARLAFALAGPKATHIILRSEMSGPLNAIYGIDVDRMLRLSNSWLVPTAARWRDSRIECIGFLSNLAPGKGLETIIATAREAALRQLPLRFLVAGPCSDPSLKSQLDGASRAGWIHWLGPVYAQAKRDFFAAIDVFLFPTTYVNEAEPLVIWEALFAGVPVIAYRRGCIAGQVAKAGVVIEPDKDFCQASLDILQSWRGSEAAWNSVAAAVAARAAEEAPETARAWKDILARLNASPINPAL